MKPKNIGIIHYQIGHTDGVSLEIAKWQLALEEMGHRVFLCAGALGAEAGYQIPELFHHSDLSEKLYLNTVGPLTDFTPDQYSQVVEERSVQLSTKFEQFFREKKIDVIIPNNVWSVANNPPVAKALEMARREYTVPAIAHHHDFYWERIAGLTLSCRQAVELVDKFMPPRSEQIRHVVINSFAQRELKERKGIDSKIIPNIFDFTAPEWVPDSYNRDFREEMGLSDGDLMVLQATRIVPRKGIELAIDLVAALNHPARRKVLSERGIYDGRLFSQQNRILLVLAGYSQDDWSGTYQEKLRRKARHSGIEIRFINDFVTHDRSRTNGQKTYSLWDTYVFADLVTYPSLWEGWGNQFLEAVKARKPIVLFEYPVFKADIMGKGFRVVSLGSELGDSTESGLVKLPEKIIDNAADQALDLLTDPNLRQETVDINFALGEEHYSMRTLCNFLADQFKPGDSIWAR